MSNNIVKASIVSIYNISQGYITRIKEETTVEKFLENVASSNGETLKLYDGNNEIKGTEYVKTGTQLKAGDTTYTLAVRGDITGDGKVSATDLSKLKQHYVGLQKIEGAALKAADINYTETITVLDISLLKMLLVGMELPEFEITTGNIVITTDTEEAAKEVTVKISVKENSKLNYDKIFYSIDGGENYKIYTGEFKITENVNLKVKLTKSEIYEDYKVLVDESKLPSMTTGTYEEYMEKLINLGYVEKVTVTEDVLVDEENYVINNIDKILPDEFEFETEKTTNSITITAETRDTMKDYLGNILADGIAGVARYEYRLNTGEWQEENIFTNLKKNTEYNISVRAIDYAGNIREAKNSGMIVKTDNITISNRDITFTYDNSKLTNEDVTVRINCKGIEEEGLKIQYQINGTDGEWIDGDICVVKENCIIYARVVDDTNQEGKGEYSSVQVTNIDKLPPLPFTPEIIEQTETNIKVRVTVQDNETTETNCSSGISTYKYHIISDSGEEEISAERPTNEYDFTDLDLENHGYYIYVEVRDKAGNVTLSEGLNIGQLPEGGLGIDVINPGPENVTINDGEFRYFNPVIPVGFKATNTPDASWEGVMPKDWNKGLVIEDINGNQFVWVPVDGINVKYEKGTKVWDYGDSAEWNKLNGQIKGDDIATVLSALKEEEKSQIEKYEGFYISRYEIGNDDGVAASKKGLKVVNGITYTEAKTYAESMYRLPQVKSGLVTGTMWDTMTKWISNEKGINYVTNNINSGNTYETAFTFSGEYATGPNNQKEMRSEYKTGENVNKAAKTRVLLTTGIVEQFKAKNIYDTAGNVWEYTTEYLINEENQKQYIARGGNYYWQYDKVVAAGTAVREFISNLEGETRNEGGFRVALYVLEGTAELGVFEDFNRTIDGKAPTYKNPVIPAGFAPVNKGADWGNGKTKLPDWNNGLVIEDQNGNEYVWVPVDGTDVAYKKWVTVGVSYEETTGDDKASVLVTWNEEEKNQIEKYGGFYIARYESSIGDTGKTESKPNKDVVVNKPYNEIKALAENMEVKEKNKKYVGTGLIAGTQWDTVMRWIANERGESDVLVNSASWGTYGSIIEKTGKTVEKNIYDLAGNAWEMTTEKLEEGNRIYRGGVYSDNSVAVAYRGAKSTYYSDEATGFRMALYITGEVKSQISTVPVREDEPLNGTKGSLPIPSAQGSITITPSTTAWTNRDITATIRNANANYYMEYQINSTTGKWTRGKQTTTITISKNCTIYSRLTNSKKQGGATVSYKVGNIDKVAPNSFRPTITSITYSSFTIKASTSDNLSGVASYKYYVNGMLAYSGSSTSYTKRGLTPETSYSVYVVATDRAGNTRKSSSVIDSTSAEPVPPEEGGSGSGGGSGGGSVTTGSGSLDDVAYVGDYVQYSAGGYNSWRVLANGRAGVYLISTGTVRNLTLSGMEGFNTGPSKLRSIAQNYLNSSYASSAESLTRSDVNTYFSSPNTASMLKCGNGYWLATQYRNPDVNANKYDCDYSLYTVESNGDMTYLAELYDVDFNTPSVHTYGVRVKVKLKSGIKVTGGTGSSSNPYRISR